MWSNGEDGNYACNAESMRKVQLFAGRVFRLRLSSC